MTLERVVLPSLVALVVLCFIATGIYQLYGNDLDLIISERSLEKENKTAPPLAVNFPNNYHATGRLFLPHSNIVEPFEIWFTKDFNRSRIDYYYGTDKTYQRADLGKYGVTFKVVPMHTEKDGNYIGCWNLEGHKGWPIIPQPIVPNMSYFKYAGEEVYMGTPATKWEYRYMVFGLLNTHTLLVSKLDKIRPVRYEMKGYDSLMASYYDNYILEYISFEEWKPDLEQFELPKDQWCYNWSHSLDSHFVTNPMGEFMSYGEDIVDEMYHVYKQHHNKIHDSHHEHVKRKHIFRHNMRYIRSVNRQNLKYKLAPNHLVDLTDEEFDGHAGLNEDNSTNHKGGVHLEEHHEEYSNMSNVLKSVDVPDELDWREYGAVTPVRGQGICGSCYALGAVGAVEGAYFMKTGQLVELSAQQIVDCSWGSGNHGCRGGWYNKALSWIYMNGVAKAKNYGPYLAQEGTCETLRIKERIKIDAFAFVPKYNNSALKRALAKNGPACVSINQKPLSLKFYSWGVYDNPECDNSSTRHTVLVVGYGKENGVPYWLVKNSWSASWGIDGYVKLAWKDNICGVTKNPVVALFKHTTFQFPVKEKINYVNPLEPDSMGRKIHAQYRPGFHRSVNGSSYHGNVNGPAMTNSSAGNRNKMSVKRKFDQKATALGNTAIFEKKEDKNVNKKDGISNPPFKTQAGKRSEQKVHDAVQKLSNSSVLTKENNFYAQKEDKTAEAVAIERSNPVNTQTSERVETEVVKNQDKTVEMNNSPLNTETNELDAQKEDETPDKTAEISTSPLNTQTNVFDSQKDRIPDTTAQPPLSKETTEFDETDAYEEGNNIASYHSPVNDEMAVNRYALFNTPEQTENAILNKKSSTVEPDYYYPSYAYSLNNPYPVEYGTQEGLVGPVMDGVSRPYEENFEGRRDSNQWFPSEGTSLETEAANHGRMLNTDENTPSMNLQKQNELLNEQHENPIMTPSTPSTTTTTTTKTTTKTKQNLKRTVKSRPTTAPKPVRHYSGKLQDIYDKLEAVIASSLKKNKRLRKNHILKGY